MIGLGLGGGGLIGFGFGGVGAPAGRVSVSGGGLPYWYTGNRDWDDIVRREREKRLRQEALELDAEEAILVSLFLDEDLPG